MMKQRISIFLLFTLLLFANGYAQKGIMHLTQQTLMHEVRETPSPLDGQHITVNPPRFMWPDKFPHLGAVLDGVEEEDYKPEVTYHSIRNAYLSPRTMDFVYSIRTLPS